METREPMPPFPTLADMLHTFLDLYEKDRVGVSVALESSPDYWLPEGMEYVSLRDQLKLILEASRRSQMEIRRKTLIETNSSFPRQRQLRELIDDPSKLKYYVGSTKPLEIARIFAEEQGVSVEQFIADDIREELAKEKVDVELLRFFADRLGSLVDAIEKLDETDFSLLVPEFLVAPFRELHVNAVLGNYGTALILCGALLEKALQDILLSDEQLNLLITQAKTKGFIRNHNLKFADRIRDDRNGVVHGSIPFGAISSDYAWDTITWTRKLISSLYQQRKNQEK